MISTKLNIKSTRLSQWLFGETFLQKSSTNVFKITDIKLPSTWEEITLGQYLSIVRSKDNAEALSKLTGADCSNLTEEELFAALYPIYSILEEKPPKVEATEILGQPIPAIARKEFARKMNADLAAKKYTGEELLARIVAIYLAQSIDDESIENFWKLLQNEPFIFVLSAGNNIAEQLAELRKSEDKIRKPEYEREEISAGVSDFKKYGVFGIVRSLALRWSCDVEEIYKWSYNKVLLELKYSADENAYQRALTRNLSKRK